MRRRRRSLGPIVIGFLVFLAIIAFAAMMGWLFPVAGGKPALQPVFADSAPERRLTFYFDKEGFVKCGKPSLPGEYHVFIGKVGSGEVYLRQKLTGSRWQRVHGHGQCHEVFLAPKIAIHLDGAGNFRGVEVGERNEGYCDIPVVALRSLEPYRLRLEKTENGELTNTILLYFRVTSARLLEVVMGEAVK